MGSGFFFDRIKNRSLRAELLRAVRNHWTHDSTALEGNTLTLGDTDFLLSEGLTVSGKSLAHHQEVYGHARAIDLVYGLLSKSSIEKDDLLLLHKAILSEMVTDIYYPIGDWKNEPNSVTNIVNNKHVVHSYPYPEVVPVLMDQWLACVNKWSNDITTAEDAIRSYAEIHAKFVAVHPFVDGNGRMARLLSNIPLLKNGFPPINIPSEERRLYLEVISNITAPCGNVVFERDLNSIVDADAVDRFGLLCQKWWEPILDLVDEFCRLDVQSEKHHSADGLLKYGQQLAAEKGFQIDLEEYDELMAGKGSSYFDGKTLVGNVIAVDGEMGFVLQSKGRGEARILMSNCLSRVPTEGEMISVSFKAGLGIVSDFAVVKSNDFER